MKNKKQYLRAFTVIELLVSLVISGLLIGFVYYIYTNLTQLSVQYQNIHLTLNDFQLAKADLKRNVEKSTSIIAYPNGFSLKTDNTQIDYFRDGEKLIKKTNQIQTELYAQIKPIKLTHYLNADGINTNSVKSITITFLVENQEISVYLYKFLSSKDKINTTLLNVN